MQIMIYTVFALHMSVNSIATSGFCHCDMGLDVAIRRFVAALRHTHRGVERDNAWRSVAVGYAWARGVFRAAFYTTVK